jgi:hypothetical protein
MSDLLHQNFSTTQSNQQPLPNTIAAAATIAPQTLMTFVTGTTEVANITPPMSGQHMLVLVFTDATPGTMVTTGNIAAAVAPNPNTPTVMFYNPAEQTYYGFVSVIT